MSYEVEANKYVIDEIWQRYGSKYDSFGGWYISGEISRATKGADKVLPHDGAPVQGGLGRTADLHLPVDRRQEGGRRGGGNLTKEQAVSIEQHEREWNEIFDGID